MAEAEEKISSILEPPRSITQASVDDKGRLKLPAEFVAYLKAVDGVKVFITTVDFRQVRIYPLPVWKRNENLFDNASENAAAAERLERIAKAFGGDAEVDGSGRVLLPAPLREEMGLEKQAVMVDVHKGRINVVSKKIHDELLQLSRANAAEDLAALVKMGFK
jgi:transcriptional regulator MraZ